MYAQVVDDQGHTFQDFRIIRKDLLFQEYKKSHCKSKADCLVPEEYSELFSVTLIKNIWNDTSNSELKNLTIRYLIDLSDNHLLDLDTVKFRLIFGSELWVKTETSDYIEYRYDCKSENIYSFFVFYFDRRNASISYITAILE